MNHNKDSFIANMTNAYIEAMVYFDFEEEYPNAQVSQEAFDKAHNDCEVFVEKCKLSNIEFYPENVANVGQDLYLTLLKHGAGFGDGDYLNGDTLTAICEDIGYRKYYVGDDGLIYPV